MTRFLLALMLALALAPILVAQAPDPVEPPAGVAPPEEADSPEALSTLYLELWQPPSAEDENAPAAGPQMLVAVGQPTVSAPIADWCEGLRRQGEASVLPEILLRGALYDRFATDSVPLLLEVLIDDVEMRYALGTERPPGTSGTSFPFFEVCAVGFGTYPANGWQLDVLHVTNHRGDSIALGVYKGVLAATERTYLETQLGYSVDLPDPAALLLLGSGRDIDTLLLVASPSSDAFDALRDRIVR